jgi:hypothetical protein
MDILVRKNNSRPGMHMPKTRRLTYDPQITTILLWQAELSETVGLVRGAIDWGGGGLSGVKCLGGNCTAGGGDNCRGAIVLIVRTHLSKTRSMIPAEHHLKNTNPLSTSGSWVRRHGVVSSLWAGCHISTVRSSHIKAEFLAAPLTSVKKFRMR